MPVAYSDTYCCGHETHAPVHSLLVIFRVLHLTHYWQESTCSSTGAEDRRRSYHASSEGGVADDVVAEIEVPGLRCCCGTVECSNANAAKNVNGLLCRRGVEGALTRR